MKIKPLYLLNVTLTIILLTSLIVNATINRSGTAATKEYDPWKDMNIDGKINLSDLIILANYFGTSGKPINTTDLLLKLQARVNSLNTSFIDLKAYLITRIVTLETDLAALQSKVGTLEDRAATLETEIVTLNASLVELQSNYSVTNLKLAPYAVPFNSTNGNSTITTSNILTFIDMDDMVINLALKRSSQLLIIFSANAIQSVDAVQHIEIVAMVNESYQASPGPVYLNPGVNIWLGHSHYLTAGSFTYVFYALINDAGTYTIKIKWRVTGGTGQIGYRSLTVIGLPA